MVVDQHRIGVSTFPTQITTFFKSEQAKQDGHIRAGWAREQVTSCVRDNAINHDNLAFTIINSYKPSMIIRLS